jgi:hypothetical protein
MRSARLLLLPLLLTACSFDEPPPPAPAAQQSLPGPSAPAVPPAQIEDPCTNIAITLLDGQLNGLPTAPPEVFDKANAVVAQFVERYDAVIVSDGVEAARAEYVDEIAAACAG